MSLPLQVALSDPSYSISNLISFKDALLIADPEGRVILGKNQAKKCVPASTLKILTSLAAIEVLGNSYRFKTEFYLDNDLNLKVKGYGDPLLTSEVLQTIAELLADKLTEFNDLVLDESYFESDIHIPGVVNTTNPYDAPIGALSVNFNTVAFKRDQNKRIVAASTKTPMVPLAREKIQSLKLQSGRYTLFRSSWDCARYVGELLLHYLEESGVRSHGVIRRGIVGSEDRLLYTHRSPYILELVLDKMLASSNNFMANQILISMGAHVNGPPGALSDGVKVVSEYCQKVLHLDDVEIAEGSGISRRNKLSALDMLAILKRFQPHRPMLRRDGTLLYKTGGLRGLKTRAGYIDCNSGQPYYFVVFLNGSNLSIHSIMKFIKTLDQNKLRQLSPQKETLHPTRSSENPPSG